MNYTLKDIAHLSVMADLANAEPIAKPQVDIKKLLASDKPKELTVQEKIVILCSKLRTEGFDNQASALEHKFLNYKSASIHLYRVIDEDGEDLINAAHPDGDNSICDATEGLGDVETILTRHKKIVDVVNKNPKGKHASIESSLSKRADIALVEISKKFRYLADYIKTHALNKFSDGSQVSDVHGKFLIIANAWYEVSNTIANELNSPATLPDRDALQLVKTRLTNSQYAPIRAQVSVLNSLSDIDELIKDVLSDVEDKNPNKKANRLSKYVKQCRDILYKEAGGEAITTTVLGPAAGIGHALYNVWQSLKSTFGDVADSAEVLRDVVADFLKDKDIQKFTALKQMLQNTTLPNLNIAITNTQLVKDLEINHKNNLPQITQYKDFYTALQSHLVDLKTQIVKDQELFKAQQSASSKAYNAVYNVFITSNANKVRSAASALYSVLGDGIVLLGQAEADAQATAPAGSTKTNTLLKPLFNGVPTSNSAVDTAVALLNSWLVSIPEANKQQVTPWIKSQIKDFQDNANNPEKVKALLKENEEFKAAWRL